ncbi:hypothetical protein IQ238_10365 [Pleurocapsales cyanobacterium LEGE 06147]|nr:hypothetical protein [Pleurocapsales cyanobacterium LEGE 06147]
MFLNKAIAITYLLVTEIEAVELEIITLLTYSVLHLYKSLSFWRKADLVINFSKICNKPN